MIDEEGQVSYLKITSWIGALHRCIDTLTSTLVRGLRERNRDAGLNYGARRQKKCGKQNNRRHITCGIPLCVLSR